MDEPLTQAAAEAYIARTCFKTGPPGLVGLEIEHVVHDRHDWSQTVTADRLDRFIAHLDLPAGGTVTREPGGQLELSTVPHVGPAAAVAAADRDLAVLYRSAERNALTLLGEGTDPLRAPHRTLRQPRYDAMESYFEDWTPAGRQMMCSTAAVQITVEAGQRHADIASTWRFLHAVGPTLIAMFANSPFLEGRPTGWKCTRQAIWWSLDPARTHPAHSPAGTRRSPTDEYIDYALSAPVMFVRTNSDRWQPTSGLTFRDWLSDDTSRPHPPTQADLDYHLTTLFPPVRARGPLEIRYLDALPARAWVLPLAVVCGLLADASTTDAARDAVAGVAERWTDAARTGLADRDLATSATTVLSLARNSLADSAVNRELVDLLDAFGEQYVERGRCPADDRLAAGPSELQQQADVVNLCAGALR